MFPFVNRDCVVTLYSCTVGGARWIRGAIAILAYCVGFEKESNLFTQKI